MKLSPEQLVQHACVMFARQACPDVLVSASQNGLYVGGSERAGQYIAKQKELGMLVGEPDLMLTWANKGILYVEVKARDRVKEKNGGVSGSQSDVIDKRREQGFDCIIIYSIDEFLAAIKKYKVPCRAHSIMFS